MVGATIVAMNTLEVVLNAMLVFGEPNVNMCATVVVVGHVMPVLEHASAMMVLQETTVRSCNVSAENMVDAKMEAPQSASARADGLENNVRVNVLRIVFRMEYAMTE